MAIIRDVLDVVDNIKDVTIGSGSSVKKKLFDIFKSNQSIEKVARESIMQFPVLVSDAVEPESLRIIVNALEQDYATFVRIAMGMDEIVELEDDETKIDYVKRFHQNIEMSNFEPGANIADMQEAVNDYILQNGTILNKELLKVPEEDLREKSLNDMTIYDPRLWTEEDLQEAMADGDSRRIQKVLDGDDIRKSNDSQPTILEMDIKYRVNENFETTRIVVGIKALSHLIKSPEMMENIAKSVKENSLVFKTIRWTTGKISFFKDFLANIDGIKREVANKRDGERNSRWWYYLKNRANYNKFKKIFSKEEFLPNTTFVITKEEVNVIKNTYGVDLMDKKTVSKLMKTFFLLGFVILDDINGIARLFNESVKDWQSYTYDSLNNDSGGGSSKKDLKMLVDLTRNR